jgi:hypothetical protein
MHGRQRALGMCPPQARAITRFRLLKDFLDRYPVQASGGRQHLEYWTPAEDLPAFNAAIVGEIKVIAAFPA